MHWTLSNFKSNALWGGTVLKNDGTVKGAVRWVRWYGTVGTVGTVRWVRWVRYGGYGYGGYGTVGTVGVRYGGYGGYSTVGFLLKLDKLNPLKCKFAHISSNISFPIKGL